MEEQNIQIANGARLFQPEELQNLRCLKLTSGEEILGCILGTNEEVFLIKHPFKVLRMITAPGQETMMMVQYVSYSNAEFSAFNKTAIASVTNEIQNGMVHFYLRACEKAFMPPDIFPEWMDAKLEKVQIQ